MTCASNTCKSETSHLIQQAYSSSAARASDAEMVVVTAAVAHVVGCASSMLLLRWCVSCTVHCQLLLLCLLLVLFLFVFLAALWALVLALVLVLVLVS